MWQFIVASQSECRRSGHEVMTTYPPATAAPGKIRLSGRRAATALVVWGVIATCLWGCSGQQIRDWTYPPDFNYISSGELRSVMSQIAAQVAALNALLRKPGAPDEITRAQIVQRLQALDAAAQRLGPGGWPSNHPRIADHAQRFQRDIALALSAAQQEPPQYFFAGSLSGSCSICHGAP